MILELTRNNADEILNTTSAPLVLFFHSPTCTHCKKTESGIKALDSEDSERAVFATVNIADEPELAERYDITTLPTLIFIKNGVVKNKLFGFTHQLIIAEEIKKLL